MFPIKNYKYSIPIDGPASFGAKRKYDIHTGVDLYCDYKEKVFAIEDGIVVNIENFTGESAGSPWWNETKSILVEGKSGVILYGEVEPLVEVGDKIVEGQLIAKVLTVLKKNKGKNPINMLHIELYTHGTKNSVWWYDEKPEQLMDITDLLLYGYYS